MLSVLPAILLLAATTAALAEEESQDRALQALRSGEIVPLSEILKIAEGRYDGTMIEIELMRRSERWLYEVELLLPDGMLLELFFDARTKDLVDRQMKPIAHEDEHQ